MMPNKLVDRQQYFAEWNSHPCAFRMGSRRWRAVMFQVVLLSRNYQKAKETCLLSKHVCKKCSVYGTQLKEALDELESAGMIIDILQKELLTSTTTKNTCGNDLISIQRLGKQHNTKEWSLVSSKNYIAKPNKNDKDESLSPDQLIMTNRFTPLSNLQTNNTGSSGVQEQKVISTPDMNRTRKQHRTGMKIPTTVGGRPTSSNNWKPTQAKKETAHVPAVKRNHKEHIVKIKPYKMAWVENSH